jgi:hypothetical protein
LDFTIKTYRTLLRALIKQGYTFQPYAKFLEQPQSQCIILRHDVEARYENALRFAEIQNKLGVIGSYYFRLLPKSYNSSIIKQIAALGHEIGYHYDDLSHCKGNYEMAIRRFQQNLDHLREFATVSTITMEGAPLSRYDNRDLWNIYDYKKYGILAEPYFDLDFNKVFYLTDTGRRWDGGKVSIRDKAMASNPVINPDFLRRRYRSTFDIIHAIESGDFPNRAMFTFHPQRWTDKPLPWAKELVMQNVKNVAKRIMLNVKF